ncbi:fructose-bisphosphate aldolase [Sulfurifustis variabilis]|uniref:Fructose-bisphosphate aldolase n=1 Tax=Sulfurifustis variabilis TaxID=1675686 RepID=A0A1B4VCZ6_9GAMM|nr:ketose-bisphosphate aldolase [Sulfurifustis variabilis]BAU49991.1 fructose-bisphosphate aldolase [Sulfurifustis variabilis]
MPLVDMRDMLDHAYRNGYAVGAFDLVSLDFLEAITDAAERCRSPVILSLAESHFEHYDFELAMAATEAAARRAEVPVAIHLDHGASLDSAVNAIRLGANGVMVDASHEAFLDNVERTRAVVAMAHACGVPVEGELGYVAGVEGEDAEKHPGEVVYTSVEEAKAYVKRTGVDFLAVSIGTVHGRLRGRPKLDCERLKRINQELRIPLVIHGGTGLAEEQFRRLIANGVAKINYYTALADAAGDRIRANAKANGAAGYTTLVRGVRAAIAEEAERCMRLWGSAGRAAEVLMQCRPWRSLQHVILYNVEGAGDAAVDALMAEGREVLARIPGVRRVVTGWAVPDKPRFRFCWLVEFASRAVIESYRDHPLHRAFADEKFWPLAPDRVSVDFEALDVRAEAAPPLRRAAN